MKPRKTYIYLQTILLGVLLMALSGGFFVFSQGANAAVGINKKISFQGKVVNATGGTNVNSGTVPYDFVFRIYTQQAPGGSPVWTETWNASSSQVSVTDGIFQVDLGTHTAFPGSVDFNSDNIYLSVEFNSTDGSGEMTPRIQFTAVPYAFNADKIHGLTVTDTTGTLTIPTGEVISFGGSFTTTASNDLTLTTGGATNVTLPTTGTLATLAGTEEFTNKTIGSTGLIFSGAASDITTTAGEALTIDSGTTGAIDIGTGANAKTITFGNATTSTTVNINSGTGGINFQAAGTGVTDSIQIGAGGSGSATPDYFGLDVRNETGDPAAAGFEGAMYYNTTDNKFRCYQGSAWTDCIGGGTTYSEGNYIDISGSSIAFDPTELGTVTWYNGTAATDIVWTFDGETNDGTFNYYEDEDAFSFTNSSLGIGTTAPASAFELYSAATADTIFTLTSNTVGNDPLIKLRSAATTLGVKFSLGIDTSDSEKFKIDSGDGLGTSADFVISSLGETTIANAKLGAQSFPEDGGILSWVDMSVTSSSADNTVMSYSAQIDSNVLLTMYALSDGAGSIDNKRVQVGGGGAGSTTPTLFALDVKSTTSDPTEGFEGAMYYNAFDNAFRCYVNSAWTSCGGAGGGTWDTIGDPAGAGAIAFGATAQTLDWATMDANASYFAFNFTNAGTSAGNDYGVVINNASNTSTGNDDNTEVLLLLQQLDTTTGDSKVVDNFIKIDVAGNAGATDGIEITNSAGNLTTGLNIVDTAGGTLATGIALSGTFTNLIDAPNFDVSDAGNVDAGGTLTAGSANTVLTLSTGMIDADALTLTAAADAGTGTSSGSGLIVRSDGIGLLQGCANGEILKWVEATDTWDCAADANTGGADNSGLESVQIFYDGVNEGADAYNESIAAVTHLVVELVGGGGGGGGGSTGDNSGGGGAGGYSTEIIESYSANEDVTVGAAGTGGASGGNTGGTSSFGDATADLQATGGVGGTLDGDGGDGGSGSNGDINLEGDDGGTGSGTASGGNDGGSSYFGGRGQGAGLTTGCTAAEGYGSGGGGNAISGNGCDGKAGIVIVWEYSGTAGSDYAEYYETDGSATAGDLVGMGDEMFEYETENGVQRMAVLEKASPDNRLVGIVSTAPGIAIGKEIREFAKNPRPIALTGRVPAKVSNMNGNIKKGDLLTASSIPGVAMKSTKAGQVIGSAMEDYDGVDDEIGKITVFVNTGYSTGARTKELLARQGVVLDESVIDMEGIDVGKIALAEMLAHKKEIGVMAPVSEIFTDRVLAGLEVVTPRLLADEVEARSGIFSGTITADRISAKTIDGLEVYDARIEVLEKLVAEKNISGEENGNKVSEISNEILNVSEGVTSEISDEEIANEEMQEVSEEKDVNALDGEALEMLFAKGGLTVEGDAEFLGKAMFRKTAVFNRDAAGFAVIEKGAKSVDIVFETPYDKRPIVNATLTGVASIALEGADTETLAAFAGVESEFAKAYFGGDVKYLVVNRSERGFTILLNASAPDDLEFGWSATAIDGVTISRGVPEIVSTIPPEEGIADNEISPDASVSVAPTGESSIQSQPIEISIPQTP